MICVVGRRYGYIPLWADDPAYIAEIQREKDAKMPVCRCSNCAPEAAKTVIESLIFANQKNFDDIMNDRFTPPKPYNIKHKYPVKPGLVTKRKFADSDKPKVADFTTRLIHDLHSFYNDKVSPGGIIQATNIFDKDDGEAILAHLDNIKEMKDIQSVIGGECFPG